MFSTTGDDNLFALESEAVVVLELFDDGIFQWFDTSNGCILCETLVDCIDRRLFYVLGCIKIRLTGPEACNVQSLGPQNLFLCEIARVGDGLSARALSESI